MQAYCEQPAPDLPPTPFKSTNVSVPANACRIMIEGGGLLHYVINSRSAPVSPQPNVWLHGFHIVDVQPRPRPDAVYRTPAITWAPNQGSTARLWVTETVIQFSAIAVQASQVFISGTLRTHTFFPPIPLSAEPSVYVSMHDIELCLDLRHRRWNVQIRSSPTRSHCLEKSCRRLRCGWSRRTALAPMPA